MEETRTLEEIQENINAAFDSVNLINEEIAKDVTVERKGLVSINVEHLELMMGKGWFVSGCTTEQISTINDTITDGNEFKKIKIVL
jgi:hypothetical protein